jgi:hypothetical protein
MPMPLSHNSAVPLSSGVAEFYVEGVSRSSNFLRRHKSAAVYALSKRWYIDPSPRVTVGLNGIDRPQPSTWKFLRARNPFRQPLASSRSLAIVVAVLLCPRRYCIFARPNLRVKPGHRMPTSRREV